jgi:FKBP-type peptidyl-prolyl cis-trans isomerase SlyD
MNSEHCMKICDHAAVAMHYTLTNAEGEVLDSSEGQDPLTYLHGTGGVIPGLEAALLDKAEGDQFTAVIEPNEAYGVVDPSLVQVVPRSAFAGVESIEAGMRFTASDEQGQQQSVAIAAVNGDEITVDGNHPLAGETLHFEVEVVSVRTATEEEISHGHVHS